MQAASPRYFTPDFVFWYGEGKLIPLVERLALRCHETKTIQLLASARRAPRSTIRRVRNPPGPGSASLASSTWLVSREVRRDLNQFKKPRGRQLKLLSLIIKSP